MPGPGTGTSRCQSLIWGRGKDVFTNVGLLKLKHLPMKDWNEIGVKLGLAVSSSFVTTVSVKGLQNRSTIGFHLSQIVVPLVAKVIAIPVGVCYEWLQFWRYQALPLMVIIFLVNCFYHFAILHPFFGSCHPQITKHVLCSLMTICRDMDNLTSRCSFFTASLNAVRPRASLQSALKSL